MILFDRIRPPDAALATGKSRWGCCQIAGDRPKAAPDVAQNSGDGKRPPSRAPTTQISRAGLSSVHSLCALLIAKLAGISGR